MFCIPMELPNCCRAVWALVALFVLTFPSVSSACSCQRTGFDDLPHVFLIRVISVEDRRDGSYASRKYDQEARDSESFGVRVRYAAEHVIKGNPANVPVLTSNYGGPDCGVLLYPGSLHIVGTNEGEVSHCDLHIELTDVSCEAVHLIHRMKLRAKDGVTTFDHQDVRAAMYGRQDLDLFQNAFDLGIEPWDIDPSDCPVGAGNQ